MAEPSTKKKFLDDPRDAAVRLPAGVMLEEAPKPVVGTSSDAGERGAGDGMEGSELALRRRLVKERFPFIDPDIREPEARSCCAIGQGGVFGLFTTEYLSEGQIPGHRYGSSGLHPSDSVGQIYTARGGFVDLGHVRDLADMTRFLATQALVTQIEGELLKPQSRSVVIAAEGGTRRVMFNPCSGSNLEIAAMTGAGAAYEVAIWHEIVTWFGPIRYSSFSPEDNFSNLLGCLVGGRAFMLQGDYDRNVDGVLSGYLSELEATPPSVTEKAIRAVGGIWYDDKIDLSADLVSSAGIYLLRRHIRPTPTVTPWLVTDLDRRRVYSADPVAGVSERIIDFNLGSPAPTPVSLDVPESAEGRILRDFYEFQVDVDTTTVPARVLPNGPLLRSKDLGTIVENVRKEVLLKYPDGDQPIGSE